MSQLTEFRSQFSLVALVGSAGALAPLLDIVSSLPADFDAAVVVVQHRDPHRPSMLADILQRRAALRVIPAKDGQKVERGTVYVAPAGEQLEMDAERRWVFVPGNSTPQHPNARCSGDHLLDSVSSVLGDGVIAVVLSGLLADGAAGARLVKTRGGRVIVQDPMTAAWKSQPSATIATGCVDFVLPAARITRALVSLMMPGGAAFFAVPLPSWAQLGPPPSYARS